MVRIDPRNRTYYWQGCNLQTSIDEPDTDDALLCKNYISITPIKCDMTDYDVLEELKEWKINKKIELSTISSLDNSTNIKSIRW